MASPTRSGGTFEVHSHSYPAGGRPGFDHSHPDGSRGHQHPETGPARSTIDKDEWLRVTGLRGGGRMRFTARPLGQQLRLVELEPWQRTFKVVLAGAATEPNEQAADGPPGGAAVARMALASDMTPVYEGGS